MTPEEQQAYVTHLRSLRTSPQPFAKAIKSPSDKPAKKSKSSIDVLSSEYGV